MDVQLLQEILTSVPLYPDLIRQINGRLNQSALPPDEMDTKYVRRQAMQYPFYPHCRQLSLQQAKEHIDKCTADADFSDLPQQAYMGLSLMEVKF
jgi:hypothetical protein